MDDGHLIIPMSFLHGCKDGLIIQYRKSGETDTGSILNEDFDVVGSSGNLPGYEFDCLVRGRDRRITVRRSV